MTNPKEKAKELLDKMTWITINGIEFCNEYDKQCALIAVEFAKENPLNTDGYNKYLQEIKTEIEKL
jgi:hypothetical protein